MPDIQYEILKNIGMFFGFSESILHCKKVVLSLCETIRWMVRVDAVIESAGGWPMK